MKITPECVPCLVKRVLFETELWDASLGVKTVPEAARMLADEFTGEEVSAELATKVHRRAYEILGTDDPYRELKVKSNEVAEGLMPQAREYISGSGDGFRAAVLVSIAGNVMDFGIRAEYDRPEVLTSAFRDIVAEGLHVDDTARMKELAGEGKTVLYFTDNCGEVVFDKLLLEELKRLGSRVVLVVKGAPILTDATREDAVEYGLDKVADLLLDTGSNAVGVAFDEMGDELRGELDKADLIISKGMANFESFSSYDYKPIAYLMRTKCKPVAQAICEGKDLNVAKVFE